MSDDVGWVARHRRRMIDGYADRDQVPAHGVTTVLLWLVAGLVHVLSAAVLAAGVVLDVVGVWPVKVVGGLLVVFGLLLLPRPGWFRRVDDGLTRADLPALFSVLDQVAGLTRAPVPDLVVVDGGFDAGVAWLGRRRILVVGAPLWVATTPPARLAVLGHELGHLAHRAGLTGRWVHAAQEALQQWFALTLDADGPLDDGYGEGIVAAEPWALTIGARAVLGVLLWPLRVLLRCWVYVIDTLAASSSRRREYLADLDAIRAGGSDGAIAALDTILAAGAVETAVARAAVRRDDDLWAEVRTTLARDDLRVRLGRRAHAEREQSRIDDSHPRTSLRIELVQDREHVSQGVVVDTATWQRVDAELAPHLDRAAVELGEAVRYRV